MTSRQTKSSSGKVVNMFIPKQNRATLIKVSSDAKLFRIFPAVLSVNTRKEGIASSKHDISDITVDIWVTNPKRSRVGVLKLP